MDLSLHVVHHEAERHYVFESGYLEDNASKAMRELSKDSLDATCALDEAQRTQQSKHAFQQARVDVSGEALNAERINKTAKTDDDAIHFSSQSWDYDQMAGKK